MKTIDLFNTIDSLDYQLDKGEIISIIWSNPTGESFEEGITSLIEFVDETWNDEYKDENN